MNECPWETLDGGKVSQSACSGNGDDQMRRRDMIAGGLASIASASSNARAEAPAGAFRLGAIHPVQLMSSANPFGKMLATKLAAYGYAEGRNLIIDAATPAGDLRRLPDLISGIAARGVNAVACVGYPIALALKQAGIPTVCIFGVGDPVETRLIDSLAHPGGNITGIGDETATLTTKRLALLREFAPGIRSIAVLWNRDDLGMTRRFEAAALMAGTLGIAVQSHGVREPDDFGTAFAAMDAQLPDAILMVTDSLTALNRKRVFEFAASRRIPAIYEFDFLLADGGLMSYGPDLSESFERASALIDAIFKGAKPANLPFEQNTRYRFVLNLKAATSLGQPVPLSLLARADEVIE